MLLMKEMLKMADKVIKIFTQNQYTKILWDKLYQRRQRKMMEFKYKLERRRRKRRRRKHLLNDYNIF